MVRTLLLLLEAVPLARLPVLDAASGRAVSLSSDGSRVAIGAWGNDAKLYNSGHVRVYEYVGSSRTWVQLGGDLDGEAADDWSGRTVSLWPPCFRRAPS